MKAIQKSFLLSLVIGLFFNFASQLFAQGAVDPREVSAPIEKIFIPAGFDDNDSAEVILHGQFPNGCYRMGTTKLLPSNDPQVILIEAKALYYEGLACAQVVMPYIQPVKIGVLSRGEYKVIVNPGNSEVSKNFSIKRRNSDSPDDDPYAPVDHAYIKTDEVNEQQFLVLEGYYPLYKTGCAKIVEVVQLREAEDLLTILPIMEHFPDGACEDSRFEVVRQLEKPWKGKGLLHVRKMEGISYNRLLL